MVIALLSAGASVSTNGNIAVPVNYSVICPLATLSAGGEFDMIVPTACAGVPRTAVDDPLMVNKNARFNSGLDPPMIGTLTIKLVCPAGNTRLPMVDW